MAKRRRNVKLAEGVCRMCGCTDDEGCAGGCSWTDADCTLCSSCKRAEERVSAEYAADPSDMPVWALWCTDDGPECRGRWMVEDGDPNATHDYPAVFYSRAEAEAKAKLENDPAGAGLASVGWTVTVVELRAVVPRKGARR